MYAYNSYIFFNANPNKLHALASLIQWSIIRDIFIKIRNNFEKKFKNVFVAFPSFLLDIIKTVFHPDSILFRCYLSCLFSDLIDNRWHRVRIFRQNFFNFLFFEIFSFLEKCQ